VDIFNPPNLESAVREAIIAALVALEPADESSTADATNAFSKAAIASLMKAEAAIGALLASPTRASAWELAQKRQPRFELDDPAPLEAAVGFVSEIRRVQTPHRFDALIDRTPPNAPSPGTGWTGIATAPWDDWRPHLFELNPTQVAICRALPDNRAVSLDRLARRMDRNPAAADWWADLIDLMKKNVVGIF
jgi:hypothetical protein